MEKVNRKILWQDKKRTFFGLPLSFTTYRLTEDKLLIDRGFLNKVQEEIRLYRIMDFTLERTLMQRIFGIGTIHICSADRNTPEFEITSVKDPETVKETMSEMVELERGKKHISGREFMFDDEHSDDGDLF